MLIFGFANQAWNSFRDYSVSYGLRVASILITGDPQFFENLKHVSLDRLSVGQVVVLSGLPFLYFYQPKFAPIYIPMVCTALLISRVVQLWQDGKLEKSRAEQNRKLEGQNALLEESFRAFKKTAQKLEKGISLCLGLSVNEIVLGEDAFNKAAAEVNRRIAEKLQALTEKVEALVVLCDKASVERSTQDLFKTTREIEGRLIQVQLEYEQRERELGILNGRFEEVQGQLSGVIDQLSESNALLKRKLIELDEAIKQFIKKKVDR
jgi:uncharacterized coiled-coil protein SlyX